MNKSEKIPARILTHDDLGNPTWVCNLYAITENELSAEGITDFDDKEDPGQEGQWINAMLSEANEHGLLTEVVQFALKYMREDPRLTPAMATRYGYLEWVK